MAPKRATFMSYGEDTQCADIRKFLLDMGVLLDIRDLEKKPLTEDELNRMIGYIHVEHFLNPLSKSYQKHNLGENNVGRDEIIALMAKDHTLIRRPIIRTNRLLTVGCDRRKICEMLQLPLNGKPPDDEKENGGIRPEAISSGTK
ncbi:MAG: ArsC/Spx/MgsR family protein [Candidatus Zixiibacteriota bacterium]